MTHVQAASDPTVAGDLPVRDKSRNVDAVVRGWKTRHKQCPKIREQIDSYCDGKQHLLMYRGDKKIPYQDKLFVIGRKAPVCYGPENAETFKKHAVFMVDCEAKMKELVDAFCATPMARGGTGAGADDIPERWSASDRRARFRLAQLLLHGIEHSNSRLDLSEPRFGRRS